MKITKEQKNMLDYNDLMIANYKSDSQKLAIELSERDKRLQTREKMKEEARQRVLNKPKQVFINHLYTFVDEKDITEDIEEKENYFLNRWYGKY